MKIISMWSGPRNVSTALMYSFAQRTDTEVIDEPLYGHYLSKVDVNHPGDREVLDHMEHDGTAVLDNILKSDHKEILFLKNMAHHWISLNDEYLSAFTNVFLIRDPKEMLASLIHQIPDPVIRDTGLKKQVELYKLLPHESVVIDSKELLTNPRNILTQLCIELKVPFDPNMLHWKSGPKKEDGIWAKHWYHNVHKSTGFTTYQAKNATIPNNLQPLLDECYSYYNFLYTKSLKN